MELVDKENIAGTHNDGPSDSHTSNESVEVTYHELCEHEVKVCSQMSDVEQGIAHLGAMVEMASKLGTEPVSTPAMEALEIAVKHLVSSLGGDAAAVAFEAYQIGGKANLQLAMESLSDTIKKLWEKIVAGLKVALAWFEKFIKSVFTMAGQMGRKAAVLRDRIKKEHTDTSIAADETIKDQVLARFFTEVDAKSAMRPAEAVQAYLNNASVMNAIGKAGVEYSSNACASLDEAYKDYLEVTKSSPQEAEARFEHMLQQKILPAFTNPLTYQTIPGVRKASSADMATMQVFGKLTRHNDVYYTDLPLPMGMFYGTCMSKGTPQEEYFKALTKCGWGIKSSAHLMKVETEEIEALSYADAIKACDLVEARMRAVSAMSGEISILKKALADTTHGAMAKVFQQEFGSEQQNVVHFAAALGGILTKVATQSELSSRSYDMTAARHMLKYVEKSMGSMAKMAA